MANNQYVRTLSALSAMSGEQMRIAENYRAGWYLLEGMTSGEQTLVQGHWDSSAQDVVFEAPVLGSKRQAKKDADDESMPW